MIEEVKNWLASCPLLDTFLNSNKPKINVERSDANINYYEIEVAPVEPLIKKFISGATIRQMSIELKWYTAKLEQEIENQKKLESLVKWFEAQNKELPAGWYSITALSNGAVYNEELNEQTAMYIISVNIQYFSEV